MLKQVSDEPTGIAIAFILFIAASLVRVPTAGEPVPGLPLPLDTPLCVSGRCTCWLHAVPGANPVLHGACPEHVHSPASSLPCAAADPDRKSVV